MEDTNVFSNDWSLFDCDGLYTRANANEDPSTDNTTSNANFTSVDAPANFDHHAFLQSSTLDVADLVFRNNLTNPPQASQETPISAQDFHSALDLYKSSQLSGHGFPATEFDNTMTYSQQLSRQIQSPLQDIHSVPHLRPSLLPSTPNFDDPMISDIFNYHQRASLRVQTSLQDINNIAFPPAMQADTGILTSNRPEVSVQQSPSDPESHFWMENAVLPHDKITPLVDPNPSSQWIPIIDGQDVVSHDRWNLSMDWSQTGPFRHGDNVYPSYEPTGWMDGRMMDPVLNMNETSSFDCSDVPTHQKKRVKRTPVLQYNKLTPNHLSNASADWMDPSPVVESNEVIPLDGSKTICPLPLNFSNTFDHLPQVFEDSLLPSTHDADDPRIATQCSDRMTVQRATKRRREIPPSETSYTFSVATGDVGAVKPARAKFQPQRRKEVATIRERGACLRCRYLKRSCSATLSCAACVKARTSTRARNPKFPWLICIPFTLKDIDIVSWAKYDIPPDVLCSSVDLILTNHSQKSLLFLQHGPVQGLTLGIREVLRKYYRVPKRSDNRNEGLPSHDIKTLFTDLYAAPSPWKAGEISSGWTVGPNSSVCFHRDLVIFSVATWQSHSCGISLGDQHLRNLEAILGRLSLARASLEQLQTVLIVLYATLDILRLSTRKDPPAYISSHPQFKDAKVQIFRRLNYHMLLIAEQLGLIDSSTATGYASHELVWQKTEQAAASY